MSLSYVGSSAGSKPTWFSLGLAAGFAAGLGMGMAVRSGAVSRWNITLITDKEDGQTSNSSAAAQLSKQLSQGGETSDSQPAKHTAVDGSPMRAYALRLVPGDELKSELVKFVQEHNLQAAAVVTCVGSLQSATIRMANADKDHPNEVVTRTERFEILSLVGTVSASHGCHLHCSLGDGGGNVFGGHCVGGMTVFTTAEIVLAECAGMAFERHFDEKTGFKELCVLCGPIEA